MDVSRPTTYDLSDYLGVLRRNWWLALGASLLGLGVAAGITLTQTKLYTSSVSVLVQPTGVQDTNVVGGRTKGDINLDTEAQLVRSTAVASDAGELMRSSKPPQQLARHVKVQVPPNTSVLVISYSEHSPRAAQAGAHAFAEAYLANRNDSAKAALASQFTTLDNKIKEVNAELLAASQSNQDGRRQNLTNQLNNLTSRLNQLTTITVNGGKIISDADLPKRADKPNVPINLASGALSGLVLGVGATACRERFDRRVRHGLDLPRRAGVPLLAELNSLSERFDPQSEAGRIFARLRNEISCGEHRSIVVTGVSSGSAASMVANNLAGAFSYAGNRVSLVTQHAADAAGQLQVETVRRNLTKLRARTDYIIIEAPSTSTSADAQSLASLADAAIMVVELRHSTRQEVLDAAEQLRRVDTALLGGIVTPFLHNASETPPRKPQKSQDAEQRQTTTPLT